LLALGTGFLLWKYKTLKEPMIVIGAALIGLAVYPLMHH
jgi:chromate transporter